MEGASEEKSSKLFVYGVNRNCPREVLEEAFGKHGRVDDVHITDKGYAFVTMSDPSEADSCIAELNGSTVDGQEIKVDKANGRRGGGGGEGKHTLKLTLALSYHCLYHCRPWRLRTRRLRTWRRRLRRRRIRRW